MLSLPELQDEVQQLSLSYAENPKRLEDLLKSLGVDLTLAPYGNGYEVACPLCGGKCVIRFDTFGSPLSVWIVCVANKCFKTHPAFKPNLLGYVRAVMERRFNPSAERIVLAGMIGYRRKANLTAEHFRDPWNRRLFSVISRMLDGKVPITAESLIEAYKAKFDQGEANHIRGALNTKPELEAVRQSADALRNTKVSMKTCLDTLIKYAGE